MAEAYLTALRMLARRELSEQQVRERLARREFAEADVDAAVSRLKDARALDDGRVALALARLEVLTKRHGRRRAERQMQAAGLSPALIREALDSVLEGADTAALLESALSRRLRHGQAITDEKHFQRLYRYLVGQGFGSGEALAALKQRR
jgi:regulatory protein